MKKIKKVIRESFPNLYRKLGNMKKEVQIKKFKQMYPATKIFVKPKSELYSQENQDYIVYSNFFKNKKDGVFFDVGGNHPLNINNTRYFEELGWNGYVLEPLPYMKPLWEKYRRARLFPFAASDSEGEVIFSLVKDSTGGEDMFSYIKETRAADYDYLTEDITVQTRMLKNIFEEENITHIDYMSIDVEGHELNVIKGIDFNKVKINVLTIENNSPGYCLNGDERIRNIMFNNGYILWGRIVALDDIYIHQDFIEESDYDQSSASLK